MRACIARSAAIATLGLACAAPARAQIDPLQFIKIYPANVVVAVDVSSRMQRDLPTDSTTLDTSRATSSYYDPYQYAVTGAAWEGTLGVTAVTAPNGYRRKYSGIVPSNSGNGDKYSASSLDVTMDNTGLTYFEAPTRMSIVRAALYQAIVENNRTARFSLVRTRQNTPTPAALLNSGPVAVSSPLEQTPTDLNSATGRWAISRPSVANGQSDGAQSAPNPVAAIQANSSTSNTDFLSSLGRGAQLADGGSASTHTLIPAGNDDATTNDTPVYNLLVDAKSEATRLIGLNSDPSCRNTVVVLIVGGGEGNTTAGRTNADLATAAAGFTSISGRRVPVYVIAIAPPVTDRASLQAVATTTGGQYYEITLQQWQLANSTQSGVYPTSVTGTVLVPEAVAAMNSAVAHAFATSTDFNTFDSASFPKASFPLGAVSEFQTVAPITGSVDLTNGHDITNAALPNTVINDKAGNLIPQRSNVLITNGFITPTLNGLAGIMRAFRVYKPVADATQLSGYKFQSDGTRLWTACVPGATATTDHPTGCSTVAGTSVADPNLRNLYTVDANGAMIAFTTANVATLAPLMNLNATDAANVITAVRSLPLGPIISSTPAIMNPPSLDPPPDDTYPAFSNTNKNRRSIIWAGSNFGIIEGIDARLGVEVWGFIPLNLLPKLKTLRDGQSIGNFDYFVDSSPKTADVKYADGTWHTHLVIGEGTGGTFYQSFDVTMTDMAGTVSSSSDDINAVLSYFSTPKITLNWSFPSYSDFDATAFAPQHCGLGTWSDAAATNTCDSLQYGDIKAGATGSEKSVGQSWSDPAVGQIVSTAGPYSVLVGSGFLPYATQQTANRGGAVAGTTFYILDAQTGALYASQNVGSDNQNETLNDCRSQSGGCKQQKNALQADPVSTGPSSSRFITAAYAGDLDGNLWRFDIGLDSTNANKPKINATTKLYASGSDQPIFSSMATVNVGGTQQYIFYGTGSDLLGGSDKNTINHLLGVLDSGATGSKTLDRALAKSNNSTISIDERVTAFPAVAGDIVFFTTTTYNGGSFLYNQSTSCSSPTANLYAFTFIGGPAYANTGQTSITNSTTPLVASIAGQRATAPFIIDQHLAFGSGSQLQMFGDPTAYNNGVGNAGVRVLSWREVR